MTEVLSFQLPNRSINWPYWTPQDIFFKWTQCILQNTLQHLDCPPYLQHSCQTPNSHWKKLEHKQNNLRPLQVTRIPISSTLAFIEVYYRKKTTRRQTNLLAPSASFLLLCGILPVLDQWVYWRDLVLLCSLWLLVDILSQLLPLMQSPVRPDERKLRYICNSAVTRGTLRSTAATKQLKTKQKDILKNVTLTFF